MEIVILCAGAFLAGMGVEWIRESKHRRALRRYRDNYEFWQIPPRQRRRRWGPGMVTNLENRSGVLRGTHASQHQEKQIESRPS
jgi:hypothetical protein